MKLKLQFKEKGKKAVRFTYPPPYKTIPRRIALVLGLLILLGILLSLLPKKMPDDYLTYVQNFMPAGMEGADFTVKFGKNVHGATVQAELWQNGVCTSGEDILLSEDTAQLHILVSEGELNNARGIPSIQVQLDVDNSTDSAITRFLLPESTVNWVYNGYIDHTVIAAEAGQEVILGAISLDSGSGVRSYRPSALTSDPSLYKNASCAIVIKADFTAEALQVRAPKPAAASAAASETP